MITSVPPLAAKLYDPVRTLQHRAALLLAACVCPSSLSACAPARDRSQVLQAQHRLLREVAASGAHQMHGLCYLSSTGVYGDWQGAWVDERCATGHAALMRCMCCRPATLAFCMHACTHAPTRPPTPPRTWRCTQLRAAYRHCAGAAAPRGRARVDGARAAAGHPAHHPAAGRCGGTHCCWRARLASCCMLHAPPPSPAVSVAACSCTRCRVAWPP